MQINQKHSRTSGRYISTFLAAIILSFLMATSTQAAGFECINSTPTANDTKSCGTHGGHYDSTHNYFDEYPWCYCQGEGCTFGSSAKPWGFCGKTRDQATVSYNQWLDFNKDACQCKQDGTAKGFCGTHGEFSSKSINDDLEYYNKKKWCYVKDTTKCEDKNELPRSGANWSFCTDDMTINKATNKAF